MIYPLVRDLAADGFPVTVACRVLGRTPQAFYKWCARPVSDRDLSAAHLVNASYDIHADDPGFGYRFIVDALEDEHGLKASANRVARLCSAHGIFAASAKRKRRGGPRPGPVAHEDLVRRDFTASGPNRLWLTDITEHRTDEGKLYLCAVKDVWSNRIVGYSIDSRMKAQIAVAALANASARRSCVGTVVHSDRGSQFRSKRFIRALRHSEAIGSMGRTGSCADNAAMESFFSLLQKNVLDLKRWSSREELRLAMVDWIERTYNRRRRQPRLGKLTPVEFEAVHQVAYAA